MNEFSTYEFAVKQRIEGKWILARIGLVFLYIAYAVCVLAVGLRVRIIVPLLALLPVTLWILIFVTWRYVSVEYEYSITSGVLTLTKIYGERSRKRVLEITLKNAVQIAPLDDEAAVERANRYRPEREFSAVSSKNATDVYFLLFEWGHATQKEKRRAVLYLEMTQKALQICKFYNPSTTSTQRLSR